MQETLMGEATTTTEGNAASTGAGQDATGQTAPATDPAQTQHATDAQSASGESTAGEAKGTEGKADAAPETYEFKAPEGQEFDSQVIGAFSDVAKELNLSQDAAQKLLDKMAPTLQARQAEQISALKTSWAESATADKEYGGDRLGENLGIAKAALDKFGTPELRTLLNESGMGNHPEVIRFMYRAGKAISEDGVVTGGSAIPAVNDPAKRLFPNQA